MSSIDIKATSFVFPHETLTPIIGKPTHDTVNLLRKELYANAFGNECTLGGGDNGYLGIIMPNDKYLKQQAVNPVPFEKPDPPDPTEPDAIKKSINQKILDYKAMEAHLKRQILAAIEREYIEALDDDSVGFARITAKALLEYIVVKYDVITFAELSTNREKLSDTWDSSEPIHRLWSRTQQIQRFAEAGNKPIDDDTAMHALLSVLQKTGVFTTHITIWNQKPQNTWTMREFQDFFDAADKEQLLHTSKEAGYANAVKSVTKTVSANAAINNTDHDKFVMVFGDKKIYYCWSHGGSTNANHTSKTCNNPKNGHVNLATWDNTCGGCTDLMISAQNKNNRFRNRHNNGRNSNGRNNGNNNNGNNNNNNTNGNNNNGNNNNGNSNGNNNRNNQQAANSSSHDDRTDN
jgi:hypothetical protein